MRTRVRIARILAGAIAFATVGLAAGISPAAATDCASGGACIWRDTSYMTGGSTAGRVRFAGYIPNYTLWNYNGTSSNAGSTATSASNEGVSQTATFWKQVKCGGVSSFSLAINTGDGNLGDSSGFAPGGFNDSLLSGSFSGAVASCRA